MYLHEVLEKYNNGDYENKLERPTSKRYKDTHVFDENKSVKWNREQVKIKNEELNKALKEYRAETQRLSYQLYEDILNAIVEEYGFNKKQAVILYNYAYREYHSNGYYEIINSLYDICDMADDFLKAGEGK